MWGRIVTKFTSVWFFSTVKHHMMLQIAFKFAWKTAFAAFKWLFPTVYYHMLVHLPFSLGWKTAFAALKWVPNFHWLWKFFSHSLCKICFHLFPIEGCCVPPNWRTLFDWESAMKSHKFSFLIKSESLITMVIVKKIITRETLDVRSDKRKPGWTLFEHQSASISIS